MAGTLFACGALGLALSLAVQPALAQTAPAPSMPTAQADCDAGLTVMLMLIPVQSPPEAALLTDGWCRVERIAFGWDGAPETRRIARIDWQAPGLAASLDGGPAPEWMALRLTGITQHYITGDPRLDYVLDAQARVPGAAIDADFALRLDPALGVLAMERARIALPAGNLVDLRIEARAAPWSPVTPWADAFGDPDALRVGAIDLTLQMQGLFEYYILPSMLEMIGGDKPGEIVTTLKDDLLAALSSADPARLSAPSREAAERLLADLPNPHGRLTLSLRHDRGLDAMALLALDLTRPAAAMARILALFDGAAVDMTYTP